MQMMTVARQNLIRHQVLEPINAAESDDGPGVPEAEREQIFEPYVRGSSAMSAMLAAGSGRGLGLGLSICRRIVEAHGGRIELRGEPGGGSCFSFVLPAAEPKDPPTGPDREG